MNTKRITTLIFTLLLGAGLAFAGDGKNTQVKCNSEQLIKVSNTMTEVAGSLVQLSASLNAIQGQFLENNTDADRETIRRNLIKVREKIALISQELNRFPVQDAGESMLEDSDLFFYED